MRLFASLLLFYWPAPIAPRPHPGLSPADVIRTVAESLRKNNSPVPNAGIFTAYQFASPANRVVTGPYGHFLRLVKLPDFAPMLRDNPQRFSPIQLEGDRAEQILHVLMDSGRSVDYLFSVSRQRAGDCRDCWMIDGVGRIP